MLEMRTDFVKYNRERLPFYQTETTIVSDHKGRRFVRKRSLTPEGKVHMAKFRLAYDMLVTRMENARVPRPSYKGEYTIFEFVPGESVEESLMRATIAGDQNEFCSILRQYVDLLRSYGTKKIDSFSPRGGLEEFFFTGEPIQKEECLLVANLDLTFDNIIIDPDGDSWITDYEWVYDSPIPLSFIIFRSLYVFYLKHSNYAPEMLPFEEALAITGVESSKKELYTNICESFIDHVFGKERHLIISHDRMQPIWRYLDTSISKAADEVVRTQEAKITESSAEIADKERTIEQQSNEIERSRLREEEQAQDIRSLKIEVSTLPTLRQEIARSATEIASKSAELESERSLSNRLNEAIKVKDAERSTHISRISELEDERSSNISRISELNSISNVQQIQINTLSETVNNNEIKIKEAQSTIERVHGELSTRQAELMAMSDWAYRMKMRLEFIDSTPLVRNMEKFYRLKIEAMDKLRSEGVKEFTKAALLKVMPRRVRHWMMNENPVEWAELINCVETNQGKVMVVFPIIPWDFRWQRPQHIVSRFAQNGYAVIFISMNITPVGRTYKNEKEAGQQVTLGKLGENIYQVWLSSSRKINVYHDKITRIDENNLELGLMAVLKAVHAKKKYFLVQFPGWSGMALTMRKKVGGRIIFDCMDEHSGFANTTDDALATENRLIKEADIVITTSGKLYDKAIALSDSVIMVKNGTDFEHFSRPTSNGQLDQVRTPIIGYYGAISDWFDAEMIEFAAKAHPEWSFILIGSTVGCDTSRLEKLTNVHLLGEKPYRELPGFLYYFDVCTIPFKVTPLTLATNPVKFYEYMSSGKPLVTVKLPELEPYKDLCYFADTNEEFVSMLQKALDEKDDETLRQKRIEFAKNNSWDQRYQDIQRSIEKI
jgi:hypothetical protein